jgi:hypothetical protein
MKHTTPRKTRQKGQPLARRSTMRTKSNLLNPTELPWKFTKTDYESNDGMLTSVWGPGIWHYLHTMSFNYPVRPTADDKTHYRNVILELQYTLPCGKCRKNLVSTLEKVPLLRSHMRSRETFSRYVYDLHETVNRMLNKSSGLTYDMVRNRYEHFRARCLPPVVEPPRQCKKTESPGKDIGCVVPLYGKKAKCVLQIVPQETKCETFQIKDFE